MREFSDDAVSGVASLKVSTRPTPVLPSADRPAVPIRPDDDPMPELLRGDHIVARTTQASDVGVVVATAKGQRVDVVGHSRCGHHAALFAATTQGLGAQSARALRLTGATAKTFNHYAIA